MARRLDKALKTGEDLPAAVADARAVAVEGGQLQARSRLVGANAQENRGESRRSTIKTITNLPKMLVHHVGWSENM